MAVVEYTWETRELPILEAVAAAEERGEDPALAARTAVEGLSDDLYGLTIANLAQGDYLDAHLRQSADGTIGVAMVVRLKPNGKRAVRQWPSGDLGEALMGAIQRAIEAEADPERTSRLRRFLEAAGTAGQDVVTQIAIGVVKSAAGFP